MNGTPKPPRSIIQDGSISKGGVKTTTQIKTRPAPPTPTKPPKK
jgi:hypothetical protein